MEQDREILCVANAYEQKFYLGDMFKGLPTSIKDELKIMCVFFTEDIGGVLTLVFDEDGELLFETVGKEDDYSYDEIGSGLKMKQLQREKAELLEALQMYYKVFVLQQDYEE